MQRSLDTLPSVKFERRLEKQKLPAFLRAYGRALVNFAESVWESQHEDIVLPESLRVLFWRFYELGQTHALDRATFQTYLKMLNDELQHLASSHSAAAQFHDKMCSELAVFGSAVQLRSGLGMERIWRHFKPDTPKTRKQLASILGLEKLADQLDVMMWKSRLKIDEMVQIRQRFAGSLQLVKTQDVDPQELVLVSHMLNPLMKTI